MTNIDLWDRSKQTYWISSFGDPWSVRDFKNNDEYVCDFPIEYQWSSKLVRDICFANTKDDVIRILEEFGKDNE